jgi:ankyrin repeat protein
LWIFSLVVSHSQAGSSEVLIIDAVLDSVSRTEANVETMRSKSDRDEDTVILNWLTPIDYGPQQSDYFRRRQAGTGQWLLDSKEFQKWLETSKQTLFCPGIPGAGKTILTSIVVDHLMTWPKNSSNIGIAYLYCDFRRREKQKAEDLLASLLKQLSQGWSTLPDGVKVLYDRHKTKRTRPSLGEILGALQSVAAIYSRVFIVVDALDECQVSDGCRSRLLSEIFNIQVKCGASVFATSRFIPEIIEKFHHCTSLEICASDEDVWKYLNGHMFLLPPFVLRRPDLQEEIKTEITKAVNGMYVPSHLFPSRLSKLRFPRFLLAQLYLGSLTGKRSPKAIRTALGKLQTEFDAYDRAYQKAMERIEGQIEDRRELAKQVLSWVTCAKRPLTTSELRHALGVEIGTSELDEENLPEIEDMISVCGGLVTVDKESRIIRLVHYTTQEYFERTWTSWFGSAQTDITSICVTYLLFNTFELGFCATDEVFENRLRLNALYDYAARNWGRHAYVASDEVKGLILDFLKDERNISGSSQAMMASKLYIGDSGYSQRVPRRVTGAHFAAYFGLKEVMLAFLSNGHHPDPKDDDGRTPLWWAAENGHEGVVKLLLADDDVDVNSKDDYGSWTPLSRAAENGHDEVVKLLLVEDDVDINSKDYYSGRTPLWRAVENEHEGVVMLLLAKDDIDVNSKDNDDWTPLSWAAENGHEGLVKLLLTKDDVDVNSKGGYSGRTPLWRAAENGHEGVVKLLLAKDDIDVNSKDYDGWTPLWRAAENGHEGVVKLLLAKDDIDVNSKDNDGWTPLLRAAENGHEGVVKLLLAKDDIDVNSEDNDGWTPLSRAARNGHEVVVKLLLAKDDDDGWAPLSWAAENGHEGVVKLLLAKDNVDVNSKDDCDGLTPLWRAVENGHEGVMMLLLAKDDVDVNPKNNNGWTPLLRAAENGHEEVVKLLLAKDDIDVNSKDNDGWTPLLRAAENGHEGVVKLLLATEDVDVNSKDYQLVWDAIALHTNSEVNPYKELEVSYTAAGTFTEVVGVEIAKQRWVRDPPLQPASPDRAVHPLTSPLGRFHYVHSG